MNDTQRMVIKMLQENTGTHFLDSGGVSGRNWQRNQTRKFSREPEATLEVWAHKYQGKDSIELIPSLSTYHFLSDALEYSPKIDREFQTFAKRTEFKDDGWLAIAEAFAEQYCERNNIKYRNTFNSYNGEDWLSQTIQGICIGEFEGIVLLQIHGGADVRGGYTKPRVFRWNSDWELQLSDNARGSIICTGETRHGWSIEPGYSQGFNDESQLGDYPQHVLEAKEKPVIGSLCARDGEAFCPICAAKLEAAR